MSWQSYPFNNGMQQPHFIFIPPPTPSPAPAQGPSGPPPSPVQTLTAQIEDLTKMKEVFETYAKKEKGDKKPSSNINWKALAHLMFWTAPIVAAVQLGFYAGLLFIVYSIAKNVFR